MKIGRLFTESVRNRKRKFIIIEFGQLNDDEINVKTIIFNKKKFLFLNT